MSGLDFHYLGWIAALDHFDKDWADWKEARSKHPDEFPSLQRPSWRDRPDVPDPKEFSLEVIDKRVSGPWLDRMNQILEYMEDRP